MERISGSAAARVPPEAGDVVRTLSQAGYEAWFVGGCVRDLLSGRTPQDWDVTTSATPQEVMTLFPRRTVPTGIRHGTVTVISGRTGVEVTTYRRDGVYKDHRHPLTVSFGTSVEEDLARRDFSVNAMAMDADGALCDPFGGQDDLRAGVLRCIGDPDTRFGEDALRVMRGLRFAATFGFRIAPETAESIRRNRAFLSDIAPERIQAELCKLLCGARATDVLRAYPDVIAVFWQEIEEMLGFDQRNPHHCYDVWEHSLHAMDGVPPEDLTLRLTMFLHDIGKPRTFCLDAHGVGHFRGHPAVSQSMAKDMMCRLRFPTALREQVELLVGLHDRPFVATEKAVGHALRQLGETTFRQLLAVKRADNLAQSPAYRERLRTVREAETILDALMARDACFSLRQLAVNGNDMKALGLSGRQIGQALDALLNAVIDGTLPNERGALLEAIRVRREKFAP